MIKLFFTMVKVKLDMNNIPQHIGIIMDGNRRWAEKRSLTVNEGHEAGAKNLELTLPEKLVVLFRTKNGKKKI